MAAKATENKKFMKSGIQKYIEYCTNGMAKCKGFTATFGPYIDYWTRLLSVLDKPLISLSLQGNSVRIDKYLTQFCCK